MAPTIQSVAATTLERIRPRLADNVFKGNRVSGYLLARNRIEVVAGHDYLKCPIQWATNSTVMAYEHYDVLDTTAQEPLTAAIYNWKQIAVNCSISGLEEMKNDGPLAVLDLWTAKLRNSEMSLREFLNLKLLQNVSLKTAKDFIGLDEGIEDDPVPAGQLGGINRTTETWWRNKYKAATLATLTADMRNLYNTCSEGDTYPDLGITTQELYEGYENQNAGKQILANRQMLDAGFENLMFKGMTLMWDRHVQGSGTANGLMYFINSDFVKLQIHRKRNFAMRGKQDAFNQDAMHTFILLGGNLTFDNSRFQGVLEVGTV